MNVYINKSVNYSDMQGPAPDGFHVPLITEWQGLKTIMDGLGLTTGDSWRINLHMPFAGSRNYSPAEPVNQGSFGDYWSSSPVGASSPSNARHFALNSANIYEQSYNARAYGETVRCFKNSYEEPTSFWTVIQGTLGGAGIFRNQTEGLISITSDGTTGYTIQDKNLGATTVYSDGDTLSESNCGKYYQWGNNYGFAWTGSVTTSSNQVNAQNYGPGNYYSSSTFITGSNDWSSVQNDNLRGGETGAGGESELKNAYIGEYIPPYLCFTANTASSTVKLTKNGGPYTVTLETSTDGNTWTTYTFGDTITLSNIGDKVYWRNTSETDTNFSNGSSNYYGFIMSGSIAASGDVNYLLNKNSTKTLSSECFDRLFYDCTSLTTVPELPATTLAARCYAYMFKGCTSLTDLPSLPVTTLPDYCYREMFANCTLIKLSSTQTGEYQTAYRIPTEGTGTIGDNSLYRMFYGTGGTFNTGTPSINTTYYTSNAVI